MTNQNTIWTVAMLLMGFYLGSWYTSIKAYTPLPFGEIPTWVGHIKTIQTLTLALFAISVGVWILADYKTQ